MIPSILCSSKVSDHKNQRTVSGQNNFGLFACLRLVVTAKWVLLLWEFVLRELVRDAKLAFMYSMLVCGCTTQHISEGLY